MTRFNKKQKEFKYDSKSKLAFSLAVELWNRAAYQGTEKKPHLPNESHRVDFLLSELEKNINTDSRKEVFARFGLPGSYSTKLTIWDDFNNEYGFRVEVGPYETETPEMTNINKNAKARIEKAWEDFNIPFESRDYSYLE